MRVELLYIDNCPNFEALASTLPSLLAHEGVDDDVLLRRIGAVHDAEEERFLGSPTIRIDGDDVERGADARTDYGIKCRLYRTGGGLEHVPPAEWIKAAIRVRGAKTTTG